ncbi:hypothetical protein [Duganella fentianensis]|uniref:hypothetical protein n=1 Tax=Duganella fentianensis TaxID=2692177 RepID=UPI0032B1971A
MEETCTPALAGQHCRVCNTEYQPDAQFCDNCGAAVVRAEPPPAPPAGAPSASVAAPAAGAEALEMVRTLVRDKTRFEPDDLQQLHGEDLQQPMTLSAHYTLRTHLAEHAINGATFSAHASDHRCDSRFEVVDAANDDSDDRLKVAHAKLAQHLARADAEYNSVSEGRYLGYARRHWHLEGCTPCCGSGKVSCYTCHGSRQETCDQCSGRRTVSCTGIGCYGGQVNCTTCYGTGSVRSSETYTEPVSVATTVYRDGQSYTSYHTEYQSRSRDVSRPCSGCSYGKVQCRVCWGSGIVNCVRCGASGSITCRTCTGAGKLTCNPCAGSGKVGKTAWIEVHAAIEYALTLPDQAGDDVRRITAAAGLHGTAVMADQLRLAQVVTQPHRVGEFRADYQLLLRIVRLAVECSEKEYDLVAYGKPLAWLTLDDIVEDLLRKDLQALSQALAQVADDGLLAADVDALLKPLHAVAASELNADVIESVLDGNTEQSHGHVVSLDYAQTVRTAVLGALRHIYTRQAKRSWWHGTLAVCGATLAVWLFSQLGYAILAGLAATAASIVWFRHRMRRLLADALGGSNQAERAIALATRSKRQRLAYFLILAPALLALVLLASMLPSRGWMAGAAAPAQGRPQAGLALSPAQRADVDAVLKRHTAGDFGYARQRLEALAQAGNPAAYGPYGWMLLLAEGLSPQHVQSDGGAVARERQARRWIDLGLAQDDSWAHAAQGVSLLVAGRSSAERSKGQAMLEQAAGRGNGAAMHFLGNAYLQGHYLSRDLAAARKWYEQAAALNQPADLYNLGQIEWHGAASSRPDRAKALLLWRRAAAMGEPNAIAALQRGQP